MRHFLANQDLGELFGAARRVFGRDHPQGNTWLTAQRQFQRGDRFGLIVLDANQRDFGLQQVAQDLRAFNHLIGMFLHQAVIGSDIRLALGGVEDQGFHPVHAALQLAGGRETGAAQPGDAGLMNTLDQLAGGQLTVVGYRRTLAPAVFAVRLNNHAQFCQPGRVSGDMRCDGADGAGGWCVHRYGTAPADGQRLAFQHGVADLDAQFTFRPQMLLQRDNKLIRQRGGTQRDTAGLGLHFRRMDPAVEIPNPVFFEGGEQIKHVAPRGSLAPVSSSYPTSSWR